MPKSDDTWAVAIYDPVLRPIGRLLRRIYWDVWYKKRHAVLMWVTVILPPYGFWWGVAGCAFWSAVDGAVQTRDRRRAQITARVHKELR